MAKVPREVLKQYYQSGDMPTQQQFATTLDSMVNFVDDRDFIGLRTYNPALDYLPGDCAVFNDQVVKCITTTTGTFNPADWTVLAAFGSVNYAGTWDTQNNDPPLVSSIGSKGFYYVVINASSDPNDNTELNGIDDWGTSDWAIFNGSVWEKVDNSTAPVEAVNVSYVPSGNLLATNVQDAIDELDAEKQPMLALKDPFIPFALAPNKLGDSWLSRVEEGTAVTLKKIIRSDKRGESQIDFGFTGDELKLSTAGSTNSESRLFLSPKDTLLYADFIRLQQNDGKSTIALQPSGNLLISNDGGSGTDCAINLSAGKVSVSHPVHGALAIGPGSDTNGQTTVIGADNTVVLTKNSVSINNVWGPGATIDLDSLGKIAISSDELQIDTAVVNISALNPSTVVIADASQNLVSSTVTSAELNSLSGITSSVQSQLDAKVNISGSTMTGALILNSDPTLGLEASTKQYTDTALSAKVDLGGSTMTGNLILNADPTALLGAATKQYVDNSEAALQSQVNTKVDRTGDTMTGNLILNADPTTGLGAATKQYTDTAVSAKVDLAGSTMTGNLILSADPTALLGAATKQYVDNGDAALQSQVNAKVDLAGDTMTGDLILNADPTIGLGAATKQYTDNGLSTKVDLSGSTMTGNLILNADPTALLGAATKQYVDSADSGLQTQVNSKLNRAGDTMTGNLVLNADPVAALGAVTKQYVDAINAALTTSINTKVSKAGDTMTGFLSLNADPTAVLHATPKQYVDAQRRLLIPFSFDTDYATSSGTFTSIPLQITVPAVADVFPGTTTITAKLTIDYLRESGGTDALGEAGLTEWTTATTGSPSLIAGSSLAMNGTVDQWNKKTSTAYFAVNDARSYRIIFRKTAGSGGARIRIESASLSLFYS